MKRAIDGIPDELSEIFRDDVDLLGCDKKSRKLLEGAFVDILPRKRGINERCRIHHGRNADRNDGNTNRSLIQCRAMIA